MQGKAHDPGHLGYAGRRVLVSRKWSGKTLADELEALGRLECCHGGGRAPGFRVHDLRHTALMDANLREPPGPSGASLGAAETSEQQDENTDDAGTDESAW